MPTLQKAPNPSQTSGMDQEQPPLQRAPHPPVQAAMEPPAYSPASPTRPYRSIQDLRAQIVANGSVIRPRSDVHRSSDDHIELIVAKTPAPRIVSSSSRGFGNSNPQTHWTEKEAMAAFNRASDPMRGTATAAGGSAGPGVGGIGEKHYALLMRRSGGNSKTVYIIGTESSTSPAQCWHVADYV